MASKKSNKKVWILLGLILVVVIVALFFRENDDLLVKTETPSFKQIVSTVSASGKIKPESEVKIFSEVNGQVTELLVKEGDRVKSGDLLLKVNPEIYRTALQRADAALSSSRASLANSKARKAQADAQFLLAENSLNRSKSLRNSGAISESEYESALSSFQVAEAELKAAEQTVNSSRYSISSSQAGKDEATENLSRTAIYAPQDGIVTALTIEKGDVILGTGMTKGDELMRISDLGVMEVDVDVNESDIVRVNLADTALIEVDAYPEKKFKGIVTEIANTAINSSLMSTDQVTNFSVKIRILESSYRDLVNEERSNFSPFRSGMSANVEVQTDYINDALSVPITSVTTRTDTISVGKRRDTEKSELSDEEFTLVFVNDNNKASIRIVELGLQDDEYYQIVSGLDKDDEIISGPYDAVSKTLRNNMKIQVEE